MWMEFPSQRANIAESPSVFYVHAAVTPEAWDSNETVEHNFFIQIKIFAEYQDISRTRAARQESWHTSWNFGYHMYSPQNYS